MPRSITDEEYNFLQSRRQVADFTEGIYNDPRWNKEAKRLIKKAYPNLPIPDLDLEDKLASELAADRKAKADAEKKAKDEADTKNWQDQRSRVQKEYSFTDDGMKELETFMQEKGVGDYEVAAGYRAAKNPRVSEAGWDDNRWNHEKRDGFAEIAKDPEGWGRTQILDAIYKDQRRARERY